MVVSRYLVLQHMVLSEDILRPSYPSVEPEALSGAALADQFSSFLGPLEGNAALGTMSFRLRMLRKQRNLESLGLPRSLRLDL